METQISIGKKQAEKTIQLQALVILDEKGKMIERLELRAQRPEPGSGCSHAARLSPSRKGETANGPGGFQKCYGPAIAVFPGFPSENILYPFRNSSTSRLPSSLGAQQPLVGLLSWEFPVLGMSPANLLGRPQWNTTEYNRLGGLKNRNFFTILEAGSSDQEFSVRVHGPLLR